MKVRPYERSTLWRSAFGKRRNDPDEKDRVALAEAYSQLRERAGDLVAQIHSALPQLTVHDLTHADTLWDVASEICGPGYELNPLEGFVLGASFLLHDAGMALAAYPNGLAELMDSTEWRDAVVSALKRKGVEDPSDDQRARPSEEIRDEATFEVLRARHAAQAKTLVSAVWTQPSTGRPLALVQNDDLLESYGELIGNISASHHWPLPEVARYFGDPTPASAAWPREWEVNGLVLACILRCADACAIDETRAPSFLFAIRKPQGESKRHWGFQNKIYPAKRRGDALIFESKSPFPANDADDWWLCFDAVEMADRELRGSDALLTDRQRTSFAVRRVMGAGDAEILIQSVRVDRWKPVNTQPKISDPQSIIEKLGGKQLYGDQPIVPIRELIQNSVDAIRARRFVDPQFLPSETNKFPGHIFMQIARIENSKEYWISVEDDGVGMSETTISRSLLDFGNSFWSSAAAAKLYPGLPSAKNFRPVGKFGIGFFSIFMYSNIATVMSREFRSARDKWNALSFRNGVRGRGNFSVEGRPTDLKLSDASTQIKIQVDEEFLNSLVRHGNIFLKTGLDDKETIISTLKELVCALDVRVFFSFLGEAAIELNDPLIYLKDQDTVWELVQRDVKDGVQKNLLCMLGGASEPYGYCGLNISQTDHCTFKSVGGLVIRERYGPDEPIVGIAEYKITAANRRPDSLAAPQLVIETWAQKQIERVLREPLTDDQRETAAAKLGELIDDIRPIFFLQTSKGGLALDAFIAELQKEKALIVPVEVYGREPYFHYYASLPHFNRELRLSRTDIEFYQFSICPSEAFSVEMVNNGSSKSLIGITPKLYKDSWSVIINTLSESKIQYEIAVLEDYVIGKYLGLDSLRHGLARGDELVSKVIKLEI